MFFFIIKLVKIHKWWKYLPLDFWSDKKFYCISACVLFFSLCSVTPEPSLLWWLASNPTTPIWQVFISALCNSIYIPPNSNTVLQFSKELTLCLLSLAMKLNCWKSTLFNWKKKNTKKQNKTKNRDLKRNKNFMGRKKKTWLFTPLNCATWEKKTRLFPHCVLLLNITKSFRLLHIPTI